MGYPLFVRGCSLIHLLHLAVHLNKQKNKQIGRDLETKEELLKHTIMDEKFDICSVSEVDLEHFDEKKPFSIKGFKTYFPFERNNTNKKLLLCFVKDSIEISQRSDLMSNLLSNI